MWATRRFNAQLRITDGQPGGGNTAIQVSNKETQRGGQLVFYSGLISSELSTISLQVPTDGSPISFFLGGKFNSPSSHDGDAEIDFVTNGLSLLAVPMMVRVRKNANNISAAERDRFLNAIVKFAVSGKYNVFLDMHNEAVGKEIHGRASFLAWHRMFVLDLERHLQEIDGSVSIPYWNFQERAENVFSADFMGVPHNDLGTLAFTSSNPLNNWRLNNLPLLVRNPRFDTEHDKALVEDNITTLERGPGFDQFGLMEIDPHGNAHTSFFPPSPVARASTAPQDPLFFMIHANVDRLWAEWQLIEKNNSLFDANQINAYNPQSKLHTLFDNPPIPPRIGDFLNDTMWPWNGVKGSPRPITAPGAPFIAAPFTDFPGSKPKVIDTVDYQGRLTNQSLSFDYDIHPYISDSEIQNNLPLLASAKGFHLINLRAKVLETQSDTRVFLNTLTVASDHDEIVQSLSNLSMLTENEY